MTSQEIEKIIVKYLSKSATLSELDILTEWVKTPENKEKFKSFVKLHYIVNYSIHNPDSDKLINELFIRIRKNRSLFVNKRLRFVLKYAAIFIGLISLTYFINLNLLNNQENDLVKGEDDIILKLNNGNIKVIANDANENILNEKGEVVGVQQGNKLKYNINTSSNEIVYNELTVPYGKIFDLVLSDGTKVKLNAGTSLKYPVNFVKDKDREVFLLAGEAYFDVTKDEKHPFIVSSNEMNVRVLGTQFCISSYPEDENMNTVLVKGSVSLYKNYEGYSKSTAQLLEPGQKASWNKSNRGIYVNEVDVSLYTAWIEGKLVFKDLPFKVIRKKLERKYNVSISNDNKLLDQNTFNATFDIETIEEVLEILDRNFGIKYEIKENKIVIN
jgi:hypothetical protein